LARFAASVPTSEEIRENLRQKLKELVNVTADDAKYRGIMAADMYLADGIKIIGHQEWRKILADTVKKFEDTLRCQAHSDMNLPTETSSQLQEHIEAVQAFTKAHNERLKGKTSAH
jgi:gas vesicle protein